MKVTFAFFLLFVAAGCSAAPEETPLTGSGGGPAVGGTESSAGGTVGDGGGALGGKGSQTASGGEAPHLLTGGVGGVGGVGGFQGPGGTGGEAESGGAGGRTSPLFPEPGSVAQCPDPSLRLRFDAAPTLGSSGEMRIHDQANPSAPVYRVNMANSRVTDTIGGAKLTLERPVYVDGDEVIFLLPSSGLEYGHSYYVILDAGAVLAPGGQEVAITDPEQWYFSVADAAPSQTSDLRVAVDGTGDFCSVQGALDALTKDSTISVMPGAYYGVTYFKNKSGIHIVGADSETTRIVGINNDNLNPGTRARALFFAEDVSDLTIENLTIVNQTPQGGSQAEALTLLSCDRCIVRNSTIRSLQDTLLWSGRIYAEDSLIEGNVDYIWGTGTAYFNRVEVRTVGRPGYNLQARNSNTNYGYVFVDSKLTAESGIVGDVLARIDVGSYPYSHVAYIDCEMGPHISPAGWTITGGAGVSNLRFWEYQSRKPDGTLVDTSQRAAGSTQLNATQAATMRDAAVVLGGWDPR